MKNILLIGTGFLLAVLVLGVTGFAYAQTQNPPVAQPFLGQGMMGGFGRGMMGAFARAAGGYGPMHEYMEQALAAKLGLTEEEIEEKLAAGETMWSFASAQGLSVEEIATLMSEVHTEALKAAVADGVLTQEQADWMAQHMQQMHANGFGPGNCLGAGPGSGARQNWRQMPIWRWYNQPTN